MMMIDMGQSNIFIGYSIGPANSSVISHLQFADDTLLLGVKSLENVRALPTVLVLTKTVSVLKMNFTKGMLVVVNIVESWPVEAASILDCTMGKVPFLYLGLPIGGNTQCLLFQDSVSTHIRNRIFGWKSRFLSFGGRLILLNMQ